MAGGQSFPEMHAQFDRMHHALRRHVERAVAIEAGSNLHLAEKYRDAFLCHHGLEGNFVFNLEEIRMRMCPTFRAPLERRIRDSLRTTLANDRDFMVLYSKQSGLKPEYVDHPRHKRLLALLRQLVPEEDET